MKVKHDPRTLNVHGKVRHQITFFLKVKAPFLVNTPLLALNIVQRRTDGWKGFTNQFNNLVLNCSLFCLFCSKRIHLGPIGFLPFFLQPFFTSAQKEFQTRSRDVLRCEKFPCRETLLSPSLKFEESFSEITKQRPHQFNSLDE